VQNDVPVAYCEVDTANLPLATKALSERTAPDALVFAEMMVNRERSYRLLFDAVGMAKGVAYKKHAPSCEGDEGYLAAAFTQNKNGASLQQIAISATVPGLVLGTVHAASRGKPEAVRDFLRFMAAGVNHDGCVRGDPLRRMSYRLSGRPKQMLFACFSGSNELGGFVELPSDEKGDARDDQACFTPDAVLYARAGQFSVLGCSHTQIATALKGDGKVAWKQLFRSPSPISHFSRAFADGKLLLASFAASKAAIVARQVVAQPFRAFLHDGEIAMEQVDKPVALPQRDGKPIVFVGPAGYDLDGAPRLLFYPMEAEDRRTLPIPDSFTPAEAPELFALCERLGALR